MLVCCLVNISSYPIEATDVIITDKTGDVCSQNIWDDEVTVVNSSPYIDVKNIDLTQAAYHQQGKQVTLSLQVAGYIENRGNASGYDFVQYTFELITSGQKYSIWYCNRTCSLYYNNTQINLTSSDFSVVGNTLSITFSLVSADELYENFSAITYYENGIHFPEIYVFLGDIAPNPPLQISYVHVKDNGYVGETIRFNATVSFLTGTPLYWYHWDFGDQSSSTQCSLTHIYTDAGVYTYTFTVTDDAGVTANRSGTITIYPVERVFLFGSFKDLLYYRDGYIRVDAVNLRMILLNPFQYFHYTSGQTIAFLNQYHGIIILNHFLSGMFDVIAGFNPTQNRGWTIDAPVNNTAILVQRLLPENIFNSLGRY
jgi:PKD repeat protein